MFLRDVKDTLLHGIETRLRRLIPEIVVYSCDYIRGMVTGCLREFLLSYRICKVKTSAECVSYVPKTRLYKDLMETLLPTPMYHSPYREYPGQDIWRGRRKCVNPIKWSAKSFFLKLPRNTLPVKTWLQEKGTMHAWTSNCPLCEKPEDIEHVFLDWWDAIFYWNTLQHSIRKYGKNCH